MTPDEEFDYSKLARPENLREAEYDESKWLDPDTGRVTDPAEMVSQVYTLFDRGEVDLVMELATERLAATEDPIQKMQYVMWLVKAADHMEDDRLMLFHLEREEEMDLKFLESTLTALEVSPRVNLGDITAARDALRKSYEAYRQSLDEGEFDAVPDEPRVFLQQSVEGSILDAEKALFNYLIETRMTKTLRVEAEGRLVAPIRGEAPLLYQALAHCEAEDGNKATAMQHIRTGERLAVADDLPLDAAKLAGMEAEQSIRHFGGLSAEAALRRGIGHLRIYSETPDADPVVAEELLAAFKALEKITPRNRLLI